MPRCSAAGSFTLVNGQWRAIELTRVGRWMSQAEHDEMVRTGRIQESAGNQTHVTMPSDPDAFQAYERGSIFVEFDVPSHSLMRTGHKWGVVMGPEHRQNLLNIRRGLPGLTEPAPVWNIRIRMGGGN